MLNLSAPESTSESRVETGRTRTPKLTTFIDALFCCRREYIEKMEETPALDDKREFVDFEQIFATLIGMYHCRQSLRTASSCLTSMCIIALLGLPVLSLAETTSDESTGDGRSAISVDDIALELSNPVTALRSLAIDIQYRTFQGDFPGSDDKTSIRTVFTPSWPFKLSNGKNILLRATIPINSDQPIWTPFGRPWEHYADFLIRQSPTITATTGQFVSGHDHLDDIGIDVAYGGVNANGFINMFGVALVMPTSDDGSAARDQWLLGPEIALGQVTSWGLFGARAKHLTTISGEGLFDGEGPWETNETSVKIFFAHALGNGWQIESNPTILYDWEAVSGNEWSVPIGVGVSKTIMAGSFPMKFAFEIQNFVVSPDRFGPEWQFMLNLTPLISTQLLR
jgi:hypothetical protein